MRAKQEKREFFNTLKNEISHREALRQFFNTTFQELLKKFDGKVYNKRFETALNESLKAVSPLMWCRCEQKGHNIYSNFPKCPRVEVQINFRNEPRNYTNNEYFYTVVVLNYDENFNARINAADSAKEKYTLAWADSFDKETATEKEILKSYDKYLKVAAKMAEAVESYNKLPMRFRENIDTQYLRIY